MAPLLLLAAAIPLAAVLWLRPYFFVRALLWLFARLFYRMRVLGTENIPQQGPALLVCNHVSYIDWVLLLVAQRRFIRFVIFAGWSRKLFIRHLLRWSRVIPIDAWSGPKAILKSLRNAGEALNEGDLVCIFAEGRFTRTGFLLPFHRGLEQIVKHTDAPIIPVCLDELWGSIFSFYGDRTIWKWPRMLPYPVTVAFGKPLPSTTAAAEVRQAVQKLTADCAVARSNDARPVHREFVRMAARRPFKPCVIDANGAAAAAESVYRYGTVLTRAMLLARQLRRRLDHQPILGIWLPPGIDTVTAHLAAAFCRKAIVHLDHHATSDSVERMVRECNLTTVLTADEFVSVHPLPRSVGVKSIDVPSLINETGATGRFLSRLVAILLPGWILDLWVLRLGRHRLDDLAAVVFTRGRTGPPKGVMLSHRNLVASVTSMLKAFDPGPSDRLLSALPLSHCTGYLCSIWAPLSTGMSVVFAASSPAAIGEHCRTHRCTVLPITPELLHPSLQASQPDDFNTVRALVCVGGKLLASAAADFRERFSIVPLEAYDCTELCSIALANVHDKTLENFTQVGNKLGTVGQPLPGIACRVVDPETLEPVPIGQSGVLSVCGANVMQGYLHRDDLTQSVLNDGWFITGDHATMDEDGFVTILEASAGGGLQGTPDKAS